MNYPSRTLTPLSAPRQVDAAHSSGQAAAHLKQELQARRAAALCPCDGTSPSPIQLTVALYQHPPSTATAMPALPSNHTAPPHPEPSFLPPDLSAGGEGGARGRKRRAPDQRDGETAGSSGQGGGLHRRYSRPACDEAAGGGGGGEAPPGLRRARAALSAAADARPGAAVRAAVRVDRAACSAMPSPGAAGGGSAALAAH